MSTFVDISTLKPNPHPVQTHPKKAIGQYAGLIRSTRVMPTIEVDEDLTILSETLVYLAAKKLGMQKVPVQIHTGLTELEKRLFALGAAKIPEASGWDRKATAQELVDVRELLIEADIDIDIDVTGFSHIEIDQLMIDMEEKTREPSDEVAPDMWSKPAVSKRGDIWLLADHKVMCADSGDLDALKKLMGNQKADMAANDIPYNRRSHDIGGRGRVSHPDFAMAAGELSQGEFCNQMRLWMHNAVALSRAGAVHYWHCDWRSIAELIVAGREAYEVMLNIAVWTKSNPGMGSFYRSQHEFVGIFGIGGASHLNNVQLGRFGRSRSNVWNYPGYSGFTAKRADHLQSHPTPKPTAMIVDMMRDCTKRDDLVIDLFSGSGTTLLAGQQIGRRVFCNEIEPRYVDVAIRRWQEFAKMDAVLLETRQTFAEVEGERTGEMEGPRKPLPRVRLNKSEEKIAAPVRPTPRVRLNTTI